MEIGARVDNPPADVTVERIGDLLAYDLQTLLAAAAPAGAKLAERR